MEKESKDNVKDKVHITKDILRIVDYNASMIEYRTKIENYNSLQYNSIQYKEKALEVEYACKKNLLIIHVESLDNIRKKQRKIGYNICEIDNNLFMKVSKYVVTIVSDKEIHLVNEFDMREEFGGSGLFTDTKFKSIKFIGVHTEDMTDMSYMFNDCNADKLDIRCFDTRNVVTMENMFSFSSVKELDLRNFNIRNVKNMKGMFKFSNIYSIYIEDFEIDEDADAENIDKFCGAQIIRQGKTYGFMALYKRTKGMHNL